MKYLVICKVSEAEVQEDECNYALTTRTVFESKEAAELYASGIAKSRGAIVISGKFEELRFDDERSKESYWRELLKPSKRETAVTRRDIPAAKKNVG